jgi:hypothetical protein
MFDGLCFFNSFITYLYLGAFILYSLLLWNIAKKPFICRLRALYCFCDS